MSLPDQDRVEETPIGESVSLTAARTPSPVTLTGSHVTLRPLEPATDASELFAATHAPTGDPDIWRYMWERPYTDEDAYVADLVGFTSDPGRRFFAIVPRITGTAHGQASYLRIVPQHGVIEIGHIWLGPRLQRTAEATEAIFLLARHAFDDLGYRRLEWKCDALNARSRHAAEPFGFVYEGTFAQHMVIKGHNRDTAWFAITDRRWPSVRAGFEAWLASDNFAASGRQIRTLAQCRGATSGD